MESLLAKPAERSPVVSPAAREPVGREPVRMLRGRRVVAVPEVGVVVVEVGVVDGTGLSTVGSEGGPTFRLGTVCAGTVAGGKPPLDGNTERGPTGTCCALAT